MDEAEKRRERLRALRTEAARPHVSYDDADQASAGSGGLLTPFSETEESCALAIATQRFDYYTDPLSAFSGANNNRTTPATHSRPNLLSTPSARNPEMTSSPAHRCQNSYFSNQQFQQTRAPTYNSGTFRSPREMAYPYDMHQVNTPESWNGSDRNNGYFYPSNFPRGYRSPAPGYGPVSSPSINNGQPQYFSGSPGHVGNPGPCSPGSGYRPIGSPGINYGRNRPQHFNSSSGYGLGGSLNSSSGRGQGRRNRTSMSPASGWNGGASRGPEQYFLASMLDDPWKDMKPVVWKIIAQLNKDTGGSSKSRFFESGSAKKARMLEASDKPGSQPSLAEVLAAAFNEAAADGPSK